MKDLHDPETRVTDGTTGGMKGKKLTQLGALDPAALIELARVAGMGAEKYAAFNYLKGYDWALSFNAMMRHALLFWSGEDVDPESGLSHMAHAAWMALCLVSFADRKLGTDTRFKQAEEVASIMDRLKALTPRDESSPNSGDHWGRRVQGACFFDECGQCGAMGCKHHGPFA